MPITSEHSQLSPRGQTQVPQWVRAALGLQPGQTLRWSVVDGVAQIRPLPLAPDPLAALGFAARHGLAVATSSDALLTELRAGEAEDA